MFNMNTIIIMFLSLLKCSLENKNFLVDGLRNQEVTMRCVYRYPLEIKRYYINLRKTNDPEIEDSSYIRNFYQFMNFQAFSITIDNQEEVNNFITSMRNDKEFNFEIVFNPINDESLEFTRLFERKLEEHHIDNVYVYYDNIHFFASILNKYDDFYIESYCNCIILRNNIISGGNRHLEKRKINKEYLTELVNDSFHIYFNILNDFRKEEIVKKYLLNYKLFLININNLLKEDEVLRCLQVETGENQEYLILRPYIDRLNVLFYFFQDTEILKNMVKKYLYDGGSDNHYLFKNILKNLQIDLVDGHELTLKKIEKNTIPSIDHINNSLIDYVCGKINLIKMNGKSKTFLINCRKLFIVFYEYIKIHEGVEVKELLEIIDEFITKERITKNNKQVICKLFSYLSNLRCVHSYNFYFRFHD